MSDADLVIVGGGPAGLATAIRARMAGLGVVLLDGARPPIDRACGEGVMPEGVVQLTSLGVRIDPRDSHPFRGVRYIEKDVVAEGLFRDRYGLGVRRTALHLALVDRAAELGVDLRWGTVATGTFDAGVTTDEGGVSARWIVGADGRNSRVRRWVGLEGTPHQAGRVGVRRHFRIAPWTDRVEVYWGPGCEAYVTPVAPEMVGVALMWWGRAAGFGEVLRRIPALADRLAGAVAASRDLGAGPFGGRARSVARGRVALVGDAARCLDPITGEGISLGLQCAEVLVAALAAGDLGRYRRAQANLVRTPGRFNRIVLMLGRLPGLRTRVVRSLAAKPDLFDRLLESRRGSVGEACGALLRLSWQLLAEGR